MIIIYLHKRESFDNFTENYLSLLRFQNSCKVSKYFRTPKKDHDLLKMPNKKAIFCNFCDRFLYKIVLFRDRQQAVADVLYLI